MTLPMNLATTNPPLTPPRRGTGQPVWLPSWEGLGVGSGAQCAHKTRGSLSPRFTCQYCFSSAGRERERGNAIFNKFRAGTEIVTLALIDNASVQLLLNIYATKG